jgi:hypothetical protein
MYAQRLEDRKHKWIFPCFNYAPSQIIVPYKHEVSKLLGNENQVIFHQVVACWVNNELNGLVRNWASAGPVPLGPTT